jgi:formylglycine-generating enzyme required for sulfatase activity
MNAVGRRFLIVLALCAGICPAWLSATGYNLAIAPAGKAVTISWPTAATNYVLQSTPTLSAANWQAVTNAVVVSSNTNYVTYTNNSVMRFFRLYLNSNPAGFYLSIAPATSNTVVVFWPAAATNYVLQTTISLTPANWLTVTNPAPVTVNNTNFVTYTNNYNSVTRFFRLYLNTNTVSPYAGMALIPAGPFTMGNSTGDSDITDAGTVTVTVSQFYMDTNLVSYGLWQSVYNYATSVGYSLGVGAGLGQNEPVQTVNWYDVVKWCNARSQQAGLIPVYYTDAGLTLAYTNGQTDAVYANWSATGYRLPTEAEWEKAARGGLSGKRFPWGNTISESQANYYVDTNDLSYDLGPVNGDNYLFVYNAPPYIYTSPVGYFGPNGYGLYDMAGNVCEWCWDWYGTPYAGGTDPHGPSSSSSGSNRVLRGGDWSDNASQARCADRNDTYSDNPGFSSPGFTYGAFGFRCVKAH